MDKPTSRSAAETRPKADPVLWFEEVGRADVARVGGKNASLGEMVQALAPKGIRVPPGFATSSDASPRRARSAGSSAVGNGVTSSGS